MSEKDKKTRAINPFLRATRDAAEARREMILAGQRLDRLQRLRGVAQAEYDTHAAAYKEAMRLVTEFDKKGPSGEKA